ncbi:MAG: hypothetical protein ABSB30_02700 [Terracidiphilus sp.]|jgi:hypothetical protein
MLQIRHSFIAISFLGALVLSTASQPAASQITPSAEAKPADSKLALKAALVLTPEFCADKTTQGSFWTNGKTKLFIGKAACAEFEPVLSSVFSSLTRIADASAAGDAQVVLVPRLINASIKTGFGYTYAEVVVLLEWTVKDRSGKTVWFETVQGHAKDTTPEKDVNGKFIKGEAWIVIPNHAVKDAVKDLALQSANRMAASPELQKLAEAAASQTPQ